MQKFEKSVGNYKNAQSFPAEMPMAEQKTS